MNKKYWVRELRRCIRHTRRLTKQIDRKLDSLAKFNKLKAHIQKELVALCDRKPYVKAKTDVKA